jgi:MraZ protein
MFFGEFQYKLDDKGRVPIPPRFRSDLKDGVVLTPGIEKCLVAYTLTDWRNLATTLTTGAVASSKLRRLNRAIFATAFNLSIDSQGRVALPAPLRQYAGIKDEVVIVGVNNSLELWNKEMWETEKTASQEQAWQIMESMEKR